MASLNAVTSTSSHGIAIGPSGNTNPVFTVDCSVSSAATGLNVIGRAATAGASLVVVSSGTNENLTIDAKGSGTITLGATSTGLVALSRALTVAGTTTITSASASALTVGLAGATNPALQVDASTGSSATGLKVKSAAAAGGLAVSVVSSGTDENLTIDGKGAGTVTINGTATGGITLTRAVSCSSTLAVASTITGTSTSASALTVGRQGATNPVLKVDASTSTVATGILVKGAAAAGGCAVSVITSGTNEALTVDAAGSGTITLAGTSTGNVISGTGLSSKHATAGLGYSTGAGGAVTQATSRTTGVTLNKVTGAITLVSAAGSTTPFSFTLTNSAIAATDVVVLSQKSGTDLYEMDVTAMGAGSCQITLNTKSGTTTEQPVFNFAVIKGVTS